MKIILRLLVALLLLIIVVVALLYIPPIQNWIKDLALERVNETMGMTIEVDDLNIGFPADVDVTIYEKPEHGTYQRTDFR